ncbi:MAG: glycosyltransferase family 4 protein, partial [Pseudomonadota bacterium]
MREFEAKETRMPGVALIGASQTGGVRAYGLRLEAALRADWPGAEVTRIDARGAWAASSPLRVAAAAARLARLAASGRADTAHLMVTERLSVWRKAALAVWARALGLQVVAHHHGAEFADWAEAAGAPGRRALRALARAAHRHVVLGEDWGRVLVAAGADPAGVEVVPNALPDRARPRRARRQGPMRVLFLGVMQPRKEAGLLVEALARLQARGVEAEAVFAGDGPARAAAEARAAALALPARFVGAVDEAGAERWMRWADVLAHPSRREGLPLTILEAMRAELPSLVAPAGAIAETLGEADGVRLAAAGDAEVWAQALARFAAAPEERRRLGRAARAAFERRFEMAGHAARIVGIYGWDGR